MRSTEQNDLSRRMTQPVAHQFQPMLDATFSDLRRPAFSVRFWDGSVWSRSKNDASSFELWLRHRAALRMLLTQADEVSFGEAFMNGDVDINGDLFEIMRVWPALSECLRKRRRFGTGALRPLVRKLSDSYSRFTQMGTQHSKPRDSAAAAFTFDQAPEFYGTFLGKSMLYSSGWFEDDQTNLDEAQESKLRRVCRKLQLHPNQRFLDIGCGWGTLMLYAAKTFCVHSHGITLSRKQIKFAEDKIREAQLGSQIEIDRRDYRDLDIIHLPFDRASSLRTSEYVGEKNLQTYFENIFQTLVPGGLALDESVTRSVAGPFSGERFADHFTFPDRELLSLDSVLSTAKQAGFEVRDVEDWREHYIKTFRCWLAALESQEHEALRYTGQRRLRGWRFYFATMAAALHNGQLSAHQVLLSKPDQTR